MAYQRPGVPMRHLLPGRGLLPQAGLFPHPPQPHGFGHPLMMVPGHVGQPMPVLMTPGLPPLAVPTAIPPIMINHPIPKPLPGVGTADHIVKVPIPSSTANMKVATTVFVGNITEKASDTLIRQILLRCGPVEGWKRVQDASGKLQGFGFCEYADPDSTLRALRLLHGMKLGEKSLVAKVDAKTRKELLKYLITKKHSKNSKVVNEDEVDKEVNKLEEDKDVATAALISEVPEEAKSEDKTILDLITQLLKGYVAVLSSSKSNEELQREHDVKESILFMAKQSGNLDPNSTLEDMDMEDDMKTLVSDEIKRFRESYKRSDEARKDRKVRDKEGERDRARGRTRESDTVSTLKDIDTPSEQRSKRDRSQSPNTRNPSSPSKRSRSPIRSRSQERAEKEKKRESLRQKERERMMKDDEEYEERNRQRKLKERDNAYKKCLLKWDERERRKEKEYEKDLKREKERREDMVRERKHLGDFLADYNDEKDDQKYYRGSAYARRHRDREIELESDERDRMREKDELEELRLQVIERQARELLSGSSGAESVSRDNEDDRDVPMAELDDDIPLTKTGYSVPPAYPPIQVHSAPLVDIPEQHQAAVLLPPSSAVASNSPSFSHRSFEEEIKQDQSDGTNSLNSPSQTKLAFGMKKTVAATTTVSTNSNQSSLPTQAKSKLDTVFTMEDNDIEQKPKKKLVPIEYSDDEEEAHGHSTEVKGGSGGGGKSGGGGSPKLSSSGSRQSRRSSGRMSRGNRDEKRDERGGGGDKGSSGGGEVGIVMRGRSRSTTLIGAEEGVRDKKLMPEERKKMVQQLVNNIPTAKDEVFRYDLKWDQIDKVLIEKRVGPWINKKIMEYIGEQEPILTEFICNKLSCHISPSDILEDIAMVLDDEAEVFIVKLWRLLIYETEAKHLGIAKSY